MLVSLTDTSPNIDSVATPYTGYVLCGQVAGWGAYLISGTGAQLLAIDALPGVVGLVAVTESGDKKWPELDGEIASAVRTKINNWLSNRGWPTIPLGWTYKRVVREIFTRISDRFDLNVFDVKDI